MSPGPIMQPQQIPHQPYMQEQSIVFVFSTELGNQAAEAVGTGLFPSIIHYHCAQESTQRMLKNYGYNGIPPQCLRPPMEMMRSPPGRGQFHQRSNSNGNLMSRQYGGPPNAGIVPLSPPPNGQMMENGQMGNDLQMSMAPDKAQKLQRLRMMQESCGFFGPNTPEMDHGQVQKW